MSDIAYIDSITDGVIDFKSPLASLAVLEKFRNSLTLLHGLLEDKSSLILEGTLDADPPNQVSSFITDANPSSGAIDRDDKFNGITLELTSGAAAGEFVITDTDAGLDRLVVLENLGALGALTGDTYVLRGHSHNGFDSEKLEGDDVLGLSGIFPIPSNTFAFTEGNTCPTGWTQINLGGDKIFIGADGTGIGGSVTHSHSIGSLSLGALVPVPVTGTHPAFGTDPGPFDYADPFAVHSHPVAGGPGSAPLNLLTVIFNTCFKN